MSPRVLLKLKEILAIYLVGVGSGVFGSIVIRYLWILLNT